MAFVFPMLSGGLSSITRFLMSLIFYFYTFLEVVSSLYFAVVAKVRWFCVCNTRAPAGRMTRRRAGYLRNSVITVRGSFLLARFDVVQITRSAITPGRLYRREGPSENADWHCKQKKKADGGGRFCPFLSRLPTTNHHVSVKNFKACNSTVR